MTACRHILNFLLVLLFLPAAAQYRFDRPVLLNAANGLPTNQVRAIAQEPDGFMWIATSEGLCRFDGFTTRIYRYDSTAGSIASNDVNAVLPLQDEVWVGHQKGISVLSLKGNSFRQYRLPPVSAEQEVADANSVVGLRKHHNGNIWIGTRRKGLWLFHQKTGNIIKVDIDYGAALQPVLGLPDQILSIEVSKDSLVWAGTTAGLLEVNTITGKGKRYAFPFADHQWQIATNAFRRMYHHDDGLLYAGSWTSGVHVFSPKTKQLLPLTLKNEVAKKILRSAVTSIYRNNEKEFWISCGSGLVLYNSELQDAVWTKENLHLEEKFYGVNYIDNNQRAWNYHMNGVQYFDPLLQQFQSFSFDHLYGKAWGLSFYIDAPTEKKLLVCPSDTEAFYEFDLEQETWRKLPFSHAGPKRLIIRGFAGTPNGDYLLTTTDGLFSFDPARRRLQKLNQQMPTKFNRWGTMVLDKDNNAWISALGEGLLYWNRRTNEVHLYAEEIFGKGNAVENISSLFCDSRNNIWMVHRKGYGVYNRKQKKFEDFSGALQTAGTSIFSETLAEDNNGRIWMGTADGQLFFHSSSQPHKSAVAGIRLNDEGIRGKVTHLAADREGNVWGYTSHDLFRISKDFSVTKYPFQYGLSHPDFYHFSFLPGNRMVFGGRTKIFLADPKELRKNPEIPRPYIDQVEVLGSEQKIFPTGEPLRLRHKERNIGISFSALAFTLSDQVKFRYRLVDVHDWTDAAMRRQVNYTNLKGGDYVFQLQAANNEGVWSDAIAELSMHISIPWWQTSWFLIGLALLISAAVYFSYRYRVAAIRRKEKLKTEYERRIANVEMSALRAQMNPHFLFNSLNSIDSYIIKNESRQASEYLNNFARLIRRILHNSKSNFITLKDELETLDLYLQMESLRFQGRFEYRIDIDPSIDPASIQLPPLLIQPYVENAIWHGIMHQANGTNGIVEISIFRSGNNLECIIRDNGIGRKRAMELAAQSHGPRRKSMGMQITKDRMEMLYKLYNRTTTVQITDLEDEDDNPAGTKVQLTIPLS